MRSREKLGLLLGLVSIIAIVYLIKGYSFVRQDSSSQSPRVLSSNQNVVDSNPDLMNDARSAVQMINDQKVSMRQSSVSQQSPRSITKLNGSRVSSRFVPTPVRQKTTPKRRLSVGYYTVKSGDSLSRIAANVYGSQGNSHDNVERIYQANKNVLKSRDVVREGQKLRIPPYKVAIVDTTKKQNFAQRIISNITGNNNRATSLSAESSRYIEYRVKRGDSLYKIAKKYLGSGNRYKEIKDLNSKKLAGGNDLEVGDILKLPRN